MTAIKLYRIGNFFFSKNIKFISKIFTYLNLLIYNSYIPSSCSIGKNTKIAYGGIGVVIHARAKIGNHCLIGQGITIGGRNGLNEVPVIEDNVYIGAGARILGNITIGHDSIIAPNAVITKNVEPYSVMGGVPAKKMNEITKENFKKYKENYGPLNFKK